MKIVYFLIMCCHKINGKLTALEKKEYCRTLNCDESDSQKVCGIRKENGGNTYKLFENECLLLKYGCQAAFDSAYGITNLERCNEHSSKEADVISCPKCVSLEKKPVCGIRPDGYGYRVRIFTSKCKLDRYNCKQDLQFYETNFYICIANSNDTIQKNNIVTERYLDEETENELIQDDDEIMNEIDDGTPVPSQDGTYVRSKDGTLVPSEDGIHVHSEDVIHVHSEDGTTAPSQIGTYVHSEDGTPPPSEDGIHVHSEDGMTLPSKDVTSVPFQDGTTVPSEETAKNVYKNIVIVRGTTSDMVNINETIKNFFASTHTFDLPIKELPTNMTENTRRRILKVFGPAKVFVPWLVIPRNITEGPDHDPLIATCYHTCPKKCPDTYAPVCGMPGILAREPSLMFKNHCFMDYAQCKQYHTKDPEGSRVFGYIEASFMFCLGDQLHGLFRFLPLVRTLQHMGRLRLKGHYRYKLKNMRLFNALTSRHGELKPMGK